MWHVFVCDKVDSSMSGAFIITKRICSQQKWGSSTSIEWEKIANQIITEAHEERVESNIEEILRQLNNENKAKEISRTNFEQQQVESQAADERPKWAWHPPVIYEIMFAAWYGQWILLLDKSFRYPPPHWEVCHFIETFAPAAKLVSFVAFSQSLL